MNKNQHDRYIQRLCKGIKKDPAYKLRIEPLHVSKQGVADTSADIPGNCFRKDIDDYKWKRNRQESKTTIQEIENKKTRLAPLYNKGPVMYIDDGIEPIYIGKKI